METPSNPLILDPTQPRVRTAPEPLAEGYYLDNFKTVLETVRERYDDLLAVEEQAFAHGFERLSQDAQRLYVRLISRKGPYFRRDRLRYDEITDLDGAILELREYGFLDDAASASAEELLSQLLRKELQEILLDIQPDLSCRSWRKGDLLAFLLESLDEDALRSFLEEGWEFLLPLHQDILTIYRLLFFGNLSQDFTTFVLHDLGVVRFEAYELRRELRRFPTRKALDDALLLRIYRQGVWEFLEQGEIESVIALGEEVLERDEAWDPSASYLRDQLFNQVGRALERQGDLDRALRFYAEAESPPARERRTRILAKLDKPREALALCSEIAEDSLDETERLFVPRFSHVLRRKLGETVGPWRRKKRPVREIRVLSDPSRSVEFLALEALASTGCLGFFAENWLWKSLFGLIFWDIIFLPVAGAFQHPFQFGPLDLHSAEFYRQRRTEIDARLDEIREGLWSASRLLHIYERKQDTANAFVSWYDGLKLQPHLELALSSLSNEQLAWVCARISQNPGRYRRGLPDLFVLSKEGDSFELLEVKGPGDQLRPEQKSWIDYLNEGGLSTSVLKVKFVSEEGEEI